MVYDGLTRKNIEVELVTVSDQVGEYTFLRCHYELDCQFLYRIETKGKTGKTLYKNSSYLNEKGRQTPPTGMDGATGHGWGGYVIGFMTQEQMDKSDLKIKNK